MNADDKTHWLKPSPPIAVDGYPSRDDHGEASSGFAPRRASGNPDFR